MWWVSGLGMLLSWQLAASEERQSRRAETRCCCVPLPLQGLAPCDLCVAAQLNAKQE